MKGLNITLIHLAYLMASVLFIIGIKRLSSVRTARQGNIMAGVAMLIAILATIADLGLFYPDFSYTFVIIGLLVGSGIGAYYAKTVKMEDMPQMVAIFNGLGGAASLLVALSYMVENGIGAKAGLGTDLALTLFLSILIGGVTLTGSVIAFGKLQGVKWVPDKPVQFAGQHPLNLALIVGSMFLGYLLFQSNSAVMQSLLLIAVSLMCLALGVLLVIPIGGGDMPVVISLLNSYSGLAAAMTGFVIDNQLLIISGSLVGASGLILTQIMCKAMNRSLTNVLFGGFGAEAAGGGGGGRDGYTNIRQTDAEEIASILEISSSVIIVPGYGMAVAQAQHAVRELSQLLEDNDCVVKFAIHPVAGRMPGHMNVLLAEADVPYEQLYEMDEINSEFKNTDLAIVLGANDVVNPEALDKKDSPIYGMPILHVHEARNVLVIKRSLSPGFAKIANPLFDADNTMMFFSDGRAAVEAMVREYKEAIS